MFIGVVIAIVLVGVVFTSIGTLLIIQTIRRNASAGVRRPARSSVLDSLERLAYELSRYPPGLW